MVIANLKTRIRSVYLKYKLYSMLIRSMPFIFDVSE